MKVEEGKKRDVNALWGRKGRQRLRGRKKMKEAGMGNEERVCR